VIKRQTISAPSAEAPTSQQQQPRERGQQGAAGRLRRDHGPQLTRAAIARGLHREAIPLLLQLSESSAARR
jgi:hypothetical protein